MDAASEAWCDGCGFDRRATEGDRCPECGSTAPVVRRRPAFAVRRAWRRFTWSIAVGAPVVGLGWFVSLVHDPTMLLSPRARSFAGLLTVIVGVGVVALWLVALSRVKWDRRPLVAGIAVVVLLASVLIQPWPGDLYLRTLRPRLDALHARFQRGEAIPFPHRVGRFEIRRIDEDDSLGRDVVILGLSTDPSRRSWEGFVLDPDGDRARGLLEANDVWVTRWMGGGWYHAFKGWP